jgi:hypothetical protein
MYTGSSVSTAVASSIAAVVWQLRPELTPAQVMKLVSRSGDRLSGQADYYVLRDVWPFSRLAPSMRKLSLCKAVVRACREENGKPCKIVCPVRNDKAADLSMIATLADESPVAPLSRSAAALPPLCRRASDPEPRLFALASGSGATSLPGGGLLEPARACPLYLLPDMVSQRWVAPQPDDPPCLSCSMIPPRHSESAAMAEVEEGGEGYILAVDIAPQWREPLATITSASLDVNRYFEGRFVGRTTYALPLTGLASGLLRFLIDGDEAELKDSTATLNLSVRIGDKTYSSQSPVYVDPP